MNTKEQASQLRLAADILETGHPWESPDHFHWKLSAGKCPMHAIDSRWEIRPILATPPDGRPLHNPDNLTAEQVGVGYRLPLKDESANQPHDFWDKLGSKWVKTIPGSYTFGTYVGSTYRLPLSVPWPELPDPYAELKAAHAAGNVIEAQMPNGEWFTYNPDRPQWNLEPEYYRIKPEPLTFIGWRYAEPATKIVDLGPEDVPPGSSIRSKEWQYGGHVTPSVFLNCVCWANTSGPVTLTYEELAKGGWQINRPANRDANGNPTKWEKCSKEVPA